MTAKAIAALSACNWIAGRTYALSHCAPRRHSVVTSVTIVFLHKSTLTPLDVDLSRRRRWCVFEPAVRVSHTLFKHMQDFKPSESVYDTEKSDVSSESDQPVLFPFPSLPSKPV